MSRESYGRRCSRCRKPGHTARSPRCPGRILGDRMAALLLPLLRAIDARITEMRGRHVP